jgi:hypothetical protein
MWKLSYHDQEQLEILLIQFTNVMSAYNARAIDYDTQFDKLLQSASEWYKSRNRNVDLGNLQIIQAEWGHARAGLDPLHHIRLQSGKSDLRKIYFLKTTRDLKQILDQNLQQTREKMDQATRLLEQIVLALIRSGAITVETMKSLSSDQLVQFWENLNGSPEISTVKNQVNFLVSKFDVIIILTDIIAQLN